MRVLGVDYGRRRIGLAVSDALGFSAHGRETLEVTGLAKAVAAVAALAKSLGVERVVVGLPLNMDGSRGESALAAETFAQELRAAVDVPVDSWDERLTSVQARRAILESGRGPRRKGDVDRVSAVLLLDAYLRARAGQGRA